MKFSKSAIEQLSKLTMTSTFVKMNGFGDIRPYVPTDKNVELLYAQVSEYRGTYKVIVRDYTNSIVFQETFGEMVYEKLKTKLFWSQSENKFIVGVTMSKGSGYIDVTDNEDAKREAALRGVVNLKVNCQTLTKSGSEHGEQAALMCALNYLRQWYPDLEYVYANANGGSRGDTERSRQIAGGTMKAEGVKAGVPDLTVPIPRLHVGTNTLYPGMFIEMKTVDGGDGGSEDQKKYMKYLKSKHYYVVLCNGYIEALKQIRWYLEI